MVVVVVVDDAAAAVGVDVAVVTVVVDAVVVVVSQHRRGNFCTNSCFRETLQLVLVFCILRIDDEFRKLYRVSADLAI